MRGFFHCFGCGEKGNFNRLLTKLNGITPAEAIQRIAEVKGIRVEYRQPDSAAIAIYEYRTRYGHPVKQVLRFPEGPNGEKIFKQRRYVNGYWKWGIQGVPPSLYHADLVEMADTVVVTEGEKDSDRITQSGLYGRGCPVVGVTSGGANSWRNDFADELRHRRVILMPDSDEAGSRYAEQVRASLVQRGIEYREISFAGTGAKDVSDFLDTHPPEELIEMIGRDWVRRESGELHVPQTAPIQNLDAGRSGFDASGEIIV
jgi:DNA primase